MAIGITTFQDEIVDRDEEDEIAEDMAQAQAVADWLEKRPRPTVKIYGPRAPNREDAFEELLAGLIKVVKRYGLKGASQDWERVRSRSSNGESGGVIDNKRLLADHSTTWGALLHAYQSAVSFTEDEKAILQLPVLFERLEREGWQPPPDDVVTLSTLQDHPLTSSIIEEIVDDLYRIALKMDGNTGDFEDFDYAGFFEPDSDLRRAMEKADLWRDQGRVRANNPLKSHYWGVITRNRRELTIEDEIKAEVQARLKQGIPRLDSGKASTTPAVEAHPLQQYRECNAEFGDEVFAVKVVGMHHRNLISRCEAAKSAMSFTLPDRLLGVPEQQPHQLDAERQPIEGEKDAWNARRVALIRRIIQNSGGLNCA